MTKREFRKSLKGLTFDQLEKIYYIILDQVDIVVEEAQKEKDRELKRLADSYKKKEKK